METQCDEAFLEEVQGQFEFHHTINASDFPRLLAIAKKCQSVSRIKDENEWLRKRIDSLTTTETQPE